MGISEEKREMLKIVTSNRTANGKNLYFKLSNPFDLIANRYDFSKGDPVRDMSRTLAKLVDDLSCWFKENPQASVKARLDD
jgi:hypothetical protein